MTRIFHYSSEELLLDSFRLGKAIYDTGLRPKHAISLWRGGTPVGLGVDAFFRSRGVQIQHTTVGTYSYTGIHQRSGVTVRNLEHLVQVICPEDDLLIIDDIYESGETIREVIDLLVKHARANTPRHIVAAALIDKSVTASPGLNLPLVTLRHVDPDVWIDFPHELVDLVVEGDPKDQLLQHKDEEIWRLLQEKRITSPSEIDVPGNYVYVSPRELLIDSIRLGINIASDETFHPDFLLALWPGGISPGLPVHEVIKYFLKKTGSTKKAPDHISINTWPTRLSYQTQVLGISYLEDNINKDDNILIIDTTFRAGRLVNDVVTRMKEALRRNLDHNRVRVASVYYNPDDNSTWTVRPDIRKPDYFIKTVRKEVIYPASIHKLPNPLVDLRLINPGLHQVLYGDLPSGG